jgi:hypothetical protein
MRGCERFWRPPATIQGRGHLRVVHARFGHQTGPRIEYRRCSYTARRLSGAFPRSARRLARLEPSFRLDKRVTLTNPNLRPVIRATTIDGTPNGSALPMQLRLQRWPSRRERGIAQSRFCGRFCNTALVHLLQFIVWATWLLHSIRTRRIRTLQERLARGCVP